MGATLARIEAKSATLREKAAPILAKVLPELWAAWKGDAKGPRLHAEVRLIMMDAGVGFDGATALARHITSTKESGVECADPERLNAELAILFGVGAALPTHPVALLAEEMKLDRMLKALSGVSDLHHKRIHSASRRLRMLADEGGLDRAVLSELVSQKADVPGFAVTRVLYGSDRVITQHVERIEKALRELEKAT